MVDPAGERTGRQALSHTLGLLPVSLAPFLFKLVGPVYLAGALAVGLVFVICAFQFARERTGLRAKALFYASILYLPVLFGLMVFDKVR
jgi:protoheme IX farnesyltransferase